ncbi:hydantoinase/oxoprolinase family protein [Thermodesulforhabdus norvegica]|uniref:N-methylhydantoinase A n=1 Tax=Thermodesulforhabdus norvegica TaxID=39841 RepID=A0A1I4UI69_9BACT|nr:hydantoinase/oxoprolinase family protein [Thermodesulforhabdus norvegica]SFM88684.1 N-methylhydantoinase A [Thermodesulforhabdus norvegica]
MTIIGVDTGGTFTDFIFRREDGTWGVYKLLSTPHNPAEAVLEGLNRITGGNPAHVVHGSTVATNAILERKGARTALITNRNFEDLMEIGRQNRHALYDLKYRKRPSLVPGDLRFGISGRVDARGHVLEELNFRELEALADELVRKGVESVAVCLLFSFLYPGHEKSVGRILEKRNIFYSLSSEVLPEFREYERMSTTVINAYVSPKMTRYLQYIKANMPEKSILRIMQSNGGSISAETAMRESVRTILSGPAGGVVGALEIGRLAGFDRLITFDMGGTSTDVALVDGKLPLTVESAIDGFPVKVPMIDIHTVGAGGGSIAYRDSGGALRVGPISAGADPGPICYGKGEEITVTDANLYLGRLVPEFFLGGAMRLHEERLQTYFEKMSRQLGLTPLELAEGILNVANTTMERAIRVISVERGYDPREFTLFSFGGAGGLHAAFLAELLNIPRVLIPKDPGIMSAVGMLLADVVKDYSRTVMIPVSAEMEQVLGTHFSQLLSQAKSDLMQEGFSEDQITMEKYLDMRYVGQSYELIIPWDSGAVAKFHEEHRKTYGYARSEKPVEVVNVRVRAVGSLVKPFPEPDEKPKSELNEKALAGRRKVIFGGKAVTTPVFRRDLLAFGNSIFGPAIIVEYSGTTVVPPGWKLRVDRYRNLVLEREG